MADFGFALWNIKTGKDVTRSSWPGETWINLAQVDSEKWGLPYICMVKTSTTVPWSPTHQDLLAEDWLIVN